VLRDNWSYTGHNLTVLRPGMETLHLDCTVTPVDWSMRACCWSFARWTRS
jgi:hypothetical protein